MVWSEMKHDELNKHFTFVVYSRSIKDAFDTDDPNSIQSVTGHASYMKKVHSLAFYDPVVGSVIRGTNRNMEGVGFESRRQLRYSFYPL